MWSPSLQDLDIAKVSLLCGSKEIFQIIQGLVSWQCCVESWSKWWMSLKGIQLLAAGLHAPKTASFNSKTAQCRISQTSSTALTPSTSICCPAGCHQLHGQSLSASLSPAWTGSLDPVIQWYISLWRDVSLYLCTCFKWLCGYVQVRCFTCIMMQCGGGGGGGPGWWWWWWCVCVYVCVCVRARARVMLQANRRAVSSNCYLGQPAALSLVKCVSTSALAQVSWGGRPWEHFRRWPMPVRLSMWAAGCAFR